MSDPTFKELMNCNLGSDDRRWVKEEVEYDDRTTASLGEIARIVFIEEKEEKFDWSNADTRSEAQKERDNEPLICRQMKELGW